MPDDLLLPATGAGSADLDHQVNHTSTIVPQVKSEKAQQMHLSSDRIEPIKSKEETEDVKKVAIILKETMSQDNNSIEKEKMAGTPFSNHTHIIKGVLKDPESTHNPASEGQLSEDMELAKLQQDNPQVSSVSVYAITTSDQPEGSNPSARTNQGAEQHCKPTRRPITNKVMTTLMEDFMEQQEKMASRREISQEDGKPSDNIKYIDSDKSEQYSRPERSIASTGYCTIETKNSEKPTVNINMVRIQANSCSKKKGTEMSSATLPARHDQQEDAAPIRYINSVYSNLPSDEHKAVLKYFHQRISKLGKEKICSTKLIRRYMNWVVPRIDLTKIKEDMAILEKDFELLTVYAVERKCGIPGCRDPVKCGQKREGRSRHQKEILYSAWDCHNPNSDISTIRNPHSKFLLSQQSENLDKEDIIKIDLDSRRGGCTRSKCPSRKKCLAIRRIQKQRGRKSYKFSHCITAEQLSAENGLWHQSEKSDHSNTDSVLSSEPSPRTSIPAVGEEEVTFYDLRTNYFITFWAKKTEKLMEKITKLAKIKPSKDKQILSQEIIEEIMSTPRQHEQNLTSRIKNLGELQYEPIIWEGEEAQMAFTTEPGEQNVRREAFILLNKTDSGIEESRKVTNQKENPAIKLTNKKSTIVNNLIQRSYRSSDIPARSQQGHGLSDQPSHDMDAKSHLVDKNSVLKEQQTEHPALILRASRKSRPKFVTSVRKIKKTSKMKARTSIKKVKKASELKVKPLFKKMRKAPEMRVRPSNRKFLRMIRDSSFLHEEFKESKDIQAARLQQAESWSDSVPRGAFKTSNYPIQFLMPFVTERFSKIAISRFNIYFNASRTLRLIPKPEYYFYDQTTIKSLKRQRKEQFGLDSIKMECSRDSCIRRSLCYGARAIKERGGSSYGLWRCYEPKIKKGDAADQAELIQMCNKAKPAPTKNMKETIPKQIVEISPSFTSRQGNHLNRNTNPKKRIYTEWAERTMRDQVLNLKIKVSYAHQPHGSSKNKCRCHDN